MILRSLSIASIAIAFSSSVLAQPAKGPKLPEGAKATSDVAYGDHERQKYDVYVPKGDGPFSLVVWVHGGGWSAGSKDGAGPGLFLLDHGYAVASINYRYSTQAVFPAQIQDCKAAILHLKANAKKYGVDPKKVGAWGASAGGHLVALLGTANDVAEWEPNGKASAPGSGVQAVIDFFGPTDLFALSGPADGAGDKADGLLGKLVGGQLSKNKAKAEKANPIRYLDKGDAPFLIVHGDRDPLVPLSQSELLAAALDKAEVAHELIVVKGGGHGGAGFSSEANRKKYVAFFDKHLKK